MRTAAVSSRVVSILTNDRNRRFTPMISQREGPTSLIHVGLNVATQDSAKLNARLDELVKMCSSLGIVHKREFNKNRNAFYGTVTVKDVEIRLYPSYLAANYFAG